MRMSRGIIAVVSFAVALWVSPALADHGSSRPRGLSALLPNLFGTNGILLAPPATGFSHAAHFTAASEAQLTVLNDSLRGQLSNIPLPSPAGSFTFSFDPALGAFTRSTESFGPIYSQRAETTGRGKLTFGGSYSRFTFDTLDGIDLGNGDLKVTFLHEPTHSLVGAATPFFFEADTITASIFADITSDVFVLSATYGLLDNLDVSIAVPIIHTSMRLRGVATINRIGTGAATGIHSFSNGSDTITLRASDESTGVGDIVLRAKWNFLNPGPTSFAAGLDLRLPSGSEDDLRGVGTVVVSPAIIFSARPLFGLAPHAQAGFHFSTDRSKLDHEFFYAAGVDWAVFRPLTLVFDILGRYVIDNQRVRAGQQLGGTDIANNSIVDASIGIKVNVWKNVIGVANVLLPLNKTGLRDKATPLFGLEVAF